MHCSQVDGSFRDAESAHFFKCGWTFVGSFVSARISRSSSFDLEPIFSSDDIMKQIPTEGRLFKTVDATWIDSMAQTAQEPALLSVVRRPNLLESLIDANVKLEIIRLLGSCLICYQSDWSEAAHFPKHLNAICHSYFFSVTTLASVFIYPQSDSMIWLNSMS